MLFAFILQQMQKTRAPAYFTADFLGWPGSFWPKKNDAFCSQSVPHRKKPILSELDWTSCLLGVPRQKPNAKSIGNSRSKQSQQISQQILRRFPRSFPSRFPMRFPSRIPRCVPKKIGACGELIIIFNNYKLCAAHSQRMPKNRGISRWFSWKAALKSDNPLKNHKEIKDDVSQKKIGACGELIIIFNNYKICAARSRRAPKTRRNSKGFSAEFAFKSDTPLKNHREFGDDVSPKNRRLRRAYNYKK